MKATEQSFPVVLFIMLYKVVLTFQSLDEILKCDIQTKATEQNFPVVMFLCCVGKRLACVKLFTVTVNVAGTASYT